MTRHATQKTSRGAAAQPAEAERNVAAIEKALNVLQAFHVDDEPLSLADLAGRTGLHKSTLLRVLGTLHSHDCIQRFADGRYHLGSRLFHWGRVYQGSLKLERYITPVLQELVQQTGEGASFSARHGSHRLCLFRVDPPRDVRDHIRAGDVLPLNVGATGLVLQAHSKGRDHSAPRYLTTFGEREPDIAAVAAPVFGASDQLIGALTLSGPLSRFTKQAVARMTKIILEASATLTSKLGGDAEGLSQTRQRNQNKYMVRSKR